ncbi:hypothetical protein EV122DRAFT_221324 [Schizophyllum commune]
MVTSTRMQLQSFLALALVVVLALFPLSATANCLPCQRPSLLPRSLFNDFVAPLEGDLVVASQPFNFRWINLDGDRVNLVLVQGDPSALKTGKFSFNFRFCMGFLAEGISNGGDYTTVVPNLPAGRDYALELQSGAEKSYTPLFTIVNDHGPNSNDL